jgi:isopenicillin-N epimerase
MTTFGRAMLEHWMLDPNDTYLNHGTVGAPPRRVLARQQALRDEIERQPARFLLREVDTHAPAPWREQTRLREAAAGVAPFLGARADDLVFVPNVTTGLNAVIRSMPLVSGDEVLITDLAYGAIALAAAAIAEERGATVRIPSIPFPPPDASAVIAAIADALSPRTKLVVVDHVTALTALVLPVADIARVCHAQGVPVLVDGAHAPGALPLDIPSLGVEWYAANLHKWAHAPRSCGILWAAPGHQANLHHPITSWGRDRGFLGEFDRTATLDPTAYLAAPEGIAMIREWGAPAVFAYMHNLAWQSAETLTAQWGTPLTTPREMVGSMVTVPLPASLGRSDKEAAALRLSLLVEERIEVQIVAKDERLWARISAQIYNDHTDIRRLADAVLRRA